MSFNEVIQDPEGEITNHYSDLLKVLIFFCLTIFICLYAIGCSRYVEIDNHGIANFTSSSCYGSNTRYFSL